MASPIHVVKVIELHAPVDKIWPLLTDTDRLNRALGLPPVTYQSSPSNPLMRLAKSRIFGLPTSWDEPPFEWIEHQYCAVKRTYHRGPMRQVIVEFRALPKGGNTRVEISITFEPRVALINFLIKSGVAKNLEDIAALCRRFEDSAWDQSVSPFQRRRSASPIDQSRLGKALEKIGGQADPRIIERLARHIQDAPDEDVVRMRPFELADRWGMDRVSVLRACLLATRHGALQMTWNVLCPNCRVVKEEPKKLAGLRASAHCEVCNIQFDSNFDRNVEARFSVKEDVRPAKDLIFCIGVPGNTPHRRAQIFLEPGTARTLRLDLPARNFALRGLCGAGRVELRAPKPIPARSKSYGTMSGPHEKNYISGRVQSS